MKSQWCNSSKCMKAFNICIIKANVKKVPKHVTLLSQRDASSPKQEQVLSSEKKEKNPLWLERTTSHTVTCVSSTRAFAIPLC